MAPSWLMGFGVHEGRVRKGKEEERGAEERFM